MPHNRRAISAADGQALQTAQQIMDAVRSAYQQQPNPMLIADGSLNPLELTVVDGQSGRYYRIPVTGNDDGTFSFGAPIPVTGPASLAPAGGVNPAQPAASFLAASRGLPVRDRDRLAAAIDRGALTAERAAYWATQALGGRDISVIDQLVGGVVIPVAAGKVTAAAAREKPGDGEADYRALFGSVEEGQRAADAVQASARAQAAALSEDELHQRLFGPGRSRAAATPGRGTAARDPLGARAAGRAGKHARAEPAGTWDTTRRPYPPRPLPIVAGPASKPLTLAWTRASEPGPGSASRGAPVDTSPRPASGQPSPYPCSRRGARRGVGGAAGGYPRAVVDLGAEPGRMAG